MTYIAGWSINGHASVCGTGGWCPTLLLYMHGCVSEAGARRASDEKKTRAAGFLKAGETEIAAILAATGPFWPTPDTRLTFCPWWSDLNPLHWTSEK